MKDRVRLMGLFAAVVTLLEAITAARYAVAADSKTTPGDKPNIIVIYCDNLGYGDIEPFGSTLHRTPNLNRMAKEGRKFTHFCVTAGVCTPSRASIMTGCYPQRVGMHLNPRDGWVLRPVSQYGLHPDEVTVAEVLKAQGYATAIVGKWHLGDQPEFLPTQQGFDWFYGVPYSDDMTQRVWARDGSQWPPLPLMENETVVEAPCDRDGLTKRYTERAMEWIAEHKDEPFFLYFPQAMPGSTKTPFSSKKFKGKSKNGPWGDSIEELDWSMGVMLDQLKELGIAENTLVIWTSDNGAPINRDLSDLSRGSNRPLHGRGYTTSEGAFRVPTIVWQPGKVPAGTTCDELTSTMDLLPTFAKLAGGDAPTDRKIDGHDIAPLLYGKAGAKTPHDTYYYYHQDQLQAVRSGPWKLFLPIDFVPGHPHFRKGQTPNPLLFNVVEDASSKQEVAAEHPEIVARLTKLAEIAREDLGDKGKPGAGQRRPGKINGEAQPQLLQKNALEVIEGVRGGRHWVDEKTAPPKSPEESLACLEIEPGLEIQLVASEPLVKDPVAIAFDRRGRMFVVEYGDYPIGPEDGGDPLSRVVYLEDSDGDGEADKRHVFADKLNFAHSLMPFKGGLLVGAQTQILFLKDSDGDNVADVREVVFDGFTPAHPQMQIGNPRWGIDNWVYLNYGPGKITSWIKPKREPVTIPRKDFRFHPWNYDFEADSGMGQFGNTVDRWGNRFYCTNRNPIMTTLLPPAILKRNPYAITSAAHYDVGKSGGDTRVYPLVKMKSNYLSHAGTHTSACGVTAYTGDLLKGTFQDSVFVCEPIGHLVTRSVVKPDGLRLTAERARPKADFIASTDTWFRPASLANGPDGALYLADMYRLWVEHPKFLPPEIAAKLDWRAGEDKGRIYRIVPKGAKPEPFTPPETADDMVQLMKSPNGWKQYLGQRLLSERFYSADFGKSVSATRPILQRMLRSNKQVTTRLHALWTLEGISKLDKQDVVRGLRDADAHVRHDAARLAHRWIDDDLVFERMTGLVDDLDARVRFQAALALGDSKRPAAVTLLADLALQDGEDSWFATGLLTSASECAGKILTTLTSTEDFTRHPIPGRRELVKRFATAVGVRGNIGELSDVLASLSGKGESAGSAGSWWKAAMISGLGQGLPRYRGDLGRLSLPLLLNNPLTELRDAAAGLQKLLAQSQQVALDGNRSAADRSAAVELLAYRPFAEAVPALVELLNTDQPVEVQTASINALSANGSEAAAKIVLDRWQTLGPAVRAPALNLLLRRTTSTKLALGAMAAGKMHPAALSIDQRVRLLKHSDIKLREQARKLFGGAVSSNRKAVAQKYQPALSLDASAEAGAKVFEKTCSKCHRINGKGHQVGPDLSDVRNRSKLALLYDILDPNSKVEPRFTAYTIATDDGKVFNGLIVSETDEAVVLRMAEGKEQAIGRGEIEVIRASDVSLMPEGVEKDIKPQDMADLLEFLKGDDTTKRQATTAK